jgi:hypothetical protein
MQPLTVTGRGFRPHERVRVSATADQQYATAVRTAGPAGSFRVAFTRLSVGRCDVFRVIAIGREGTHAVLKRLPSPACSLQRTPG